MTANALGRFQPVFNVYLYGATGNGVVDDTAAIQAAIDAASKVFAGVVYFPIGGSLGVYRVDGTLNLDDQENITLLGEAGNTALYQAPTAGATLLRDSGSGPMVRWRSVTQGTSLRGCGIKNLLFEANGLASECLILSDIYGGIFESLLFRGATSTLLDLTSAVGTEGLQGCIFRNISIDCASDTAAASATGMKWSGATGNVSYNLFEGMRIHHKNGIGIDGGDSDHNLILNAVILSSGSGVGIVLQGSNTAQSHCRHNAFYSCSPISGVSAKATGLTYPSASNVFFVGQGLGANAVPLPTIEAGATLDWRDDSGVEIRSGLPTSDPHVVGQFWNSSGALKVSAG